jgi:predicted transglutaminase-like cysteine proteinase
VLAAVLALLASGEARSFPADLFGFRQQAQEDIADFPQWVSVLERHLRDDLVEGDCGERRLNRCHLAEWRTLIEGIRSLSPEEQLDRVNRYVNERRYILDIDLYGLEDYWAIPREFLPQGGDCEDFAIAKFLSLKWLGYDPGSIRVVVVQDTNLRIPHAVLAVQRGDDIRILDNQVRRVVSHRDIVHYVPVYSINEQRWWLHLPAGAGERAG